MGRMRWGGRRRVCALLAAKEESFLFACGIVFIHMVALRGTLADPCPPECHCLEETGVVGCHSQDIPAQLPRWVRTLTITGANMTILGAGAFANNGTALLNLTSLVLTHNEVQLLEGQAFQGLSNLATLDLSHNALRSISLGAFWGLPQLRTLRMNCALQEGAAGQLSAALLNKSHLSDLELTDNRLQALPEALLELAELRTLNLRHNWLPALDVPTVQGLYRQRRLQLLLSGNPFVCDCHLKTMLFWLRNTSQARDAQDLRCALPARMNSSYITRLKSEDLKCINEDLETASYVFFGIVLALIGVIFLMVLYLNRRGMKKWLNNFREACRDQMEGYHYRYEQDSDARRVHFSGGVEV